MDRGTRVPLRVQLERELRRAIQTRRLEAGAFLPSTRTLAADLDVARGVVVEAYEQLPAEGYVRAHQGSPTRIAARRTVVREAPPEAVALVASLHRHVATLRLHGVAAGLHVLIELAGGVDERTAVEAAARRSIRVYGGGDAYWAKPLAGPPTILVGYARSLEEDDAETPVW